MKAKGLDSLRVEHRKIDQEIQMEYAKHDHDNTRINELKRQKLKIKDRLLAAGSA